MSQLALLGGDPVRTKPFPRYCTIGEEEKRAVMAVLDSGVLSDFLGMYHDKFLGGEQVRAFEDEWRAYFGVAYAVSVNSATSGLNAALGALQLSPDDEVIVSPYTMSASATCAVIYGAVPVFVDVERDYFCLAPGEIARRITPRTRAIVVVDLAGQPAALDEIMALAAQHRLWVIEDCAQAPGARYKGRMAGTVGHIGVFSLNCHKTIQTGEGGMVVTDDSNLAHRVRLIRNHAEAVIDGMPDPPADLQGLYGWNYRMTEIEAAIGRIQLQKLEKLNRGRIERVAYLEAGLRHIPGLTLPPVRPDCTHVYYTHMIRMDCCAMGVSRDLFVKALQAEGIPVSGGYVRPLFRQPLYRKRSSGHASCPVVERLHDEEIIVNYLVYPPLTHRDLDDVISAYEKVAENAKVLRAVPS